MKVQLTDEKDGQTEDDSRAQRRIEAKCSIGTRLGLERATTELKNKGRFMEYLTSL